MELAEENCLIQ